MTAGSSAHPALIHVTSAAAALVARWAGTDVATIRPHRAAGTMGTGAAEAGVRQGAVRASEPTRTAAGEAGGACYHRALADTSASTGA